jgi:tyramine---L-glutamate ligase
MRVFVSEYVCGGAWPDELLDNSMAAEGRAMLVSLVQDLLRIPAVNVVTTWDQRLGTFPIDRLTGLTVVRTRSSTEEEYEFKRLCEESDAAFVIAPEFHGILAARVKTASKLTSLAGCNFEATALCSDKLRLAEFLSDVGISTIPTECFEPTLGEFAAPSFEPAFPCVIKPRDGAGSVLTFKVLNFAELKQRSKHFLTAGGDFRFVRQPFVEGIAVSCAAIVVADQARQRAGTQKSLHIDVLPPCEQILSGDGTFRYEGADYPGRLKPSDRDRIENIVRRCCASIPGLNGYVGFDLLIPHNDAVPCVVEINPRLTTGYLLWRKLCNENLAARMSGLSLSDDPVGDESLSWKSGPNAIRVNSLSNNGTCPK